MIFLKEEVWNSLPLNDWRARFFIESYCEALSIFTPHFHQSKLMGLINLSNEVLDNILVFEENGKGKGYLISSLNELKECFDSDDVASEVFHDIKEIFESCAKQFSSESFPRSLLLQLGLVCKRISVDKDIYYEKISYSLYNSVVSIYDTTQKARLTKKINSLTRLYVSFLLSEGYSPTFLYNRAQKLTRINNYNNNSFSQQLESFMNGLDSKKRDFHVFFGIKTNKASVINTYDSFKGFRVINEIPEKQYTISKRTFIKFSPDFYFKLTIKGLDYVSASLEAYDYLESELDFLKTVLPSAKIEHHSSCYIEYRTKGHTHQNMVRVSLLNKMLTYDQRAEELTGYIDSSLRKTLNRYSRKAIEGAFKNLRIAKETAHLEQKLLSLWVAFETLSYSSDEQSIISGVINYTPKLYAINSVKDRASYVLLLLSKNEVKIPDSIREKYSLEEDVFCESLDLESFYSIVSNKEDAIKIYDSIPSLDLANFRLINLHFLISDKSAVKKRIEDTRSDIEKHLYRIYKQRNSIVHNGFSENLSHYTINHLADYIYTQLLSIIEISNKSSHLSELSLNDILLSNHLVVDSIFIKVKNNTLNGYNDLKLPVII